MATPTGDPLSFTGADGKTYYLSAGGMYYDVAGNPYPGNPGVAGAPAPGGYGATYPAPTGTAPTWGTAPGIGTAPVAPEGTATRDRGVLPGRWDDPVGTAALPTSGTGYGAPVTYPTGATPVTWGAGPAAAGPDMSWRNNDQYSVYGRHLGTGSYFQGAGGQPLDTTQQLFYQTDAGRQAGYARFMGEEADPTSYYYRWLGNQQGRVEQDFRNASVADPNLQYTQYLDSSAKGLYDAYRNLPGWQQGQNPGVTWAGRRM